MKHKIDINNIDALRAIFHIHIRNKFIWGLCIFSGFPIYVNFIGLWAKGFPIIDTLLTVIVLIVWVLSLNTISFIFTAIGLLLNPKWRKGRIGEHTISIDEHGIIEETIYNRTELKWPAINYLTEGYGVLYIMHSGSEIFPVPKRCFSNSSDWQEFVDNIKLNLKSSNAG